MLDIDGALDAAPTGSSALHPDRKTIVHTFSVFANPLLTDAERPDPADPDVRVVTPGESPPADFDETTLYFAPGVHNLSHVPECCSTSDPSAACQCVNDNAGPSYPGYVAPFLLRSGKRLYLPADAWLDGWLLSEASWGIEGTNITGYGVLSGRRMRWKEGDYFSCRAIQLRGATDCHIVGPTLVDFPNHHLILSGVSSSAALAAPNTLRHVKVFGWRTNGDGIHIWGHWNEVTDLFLRTQDDCAYVGDEASATTFRRLTTWNDANGVPFMLGSQNGAPTVVEDCDVIYHRKQFPYWCGAVFDRRGAVARDRLGDATSVTFRHIRCSDPYPTCPLLDLSGTYTHVRFEHVTSAAHSAYTELPPWYCEQSLNGNVAYRFGLSADFGCELPFGVPSRLVGGNCHHDEGAHGCTSLADTSYNISHLVFTNVTMANR